MDTLSIIAIPLGQWPLALVCAKRFPPLSGRGYLFTFLAVAALQAAQTVVLEAYCYGPSAATWDTLLLVLLLVPVPSAVEGLLAWLGIGLAQEKGIRQQIGILLVSLGFLAVLALEFSRALLFDACSGHW